MTQPVERENFSGGPWILTLIATFLILPGLGVPLLSIDEPTTLDLIEKARQTGLTAAVATHLDGFLFAAIQYGAAKMAGTGNFALRLPAALAGILSAPLVFFVMRIFLSPARSFWYALFFTASPIALYYAGEARAYPWTILFFLAFILCYFSPRIRKEWLRVGAVSASAFCLVLIHNIGVFYLAGFFLCMGAYRLGRKKFTKLWKDFLRGLVCLAAVLPVVLSRLAELRDIPQGYLVHTDISLARVLSEEFFFLNPNSASGDETFALLLLAGIFAPLFLFLLARRIKPQKPGLVLLWLMPALLSLILEVLLQKKLLYYPRAYFATLPFALVFIFENALRALPSLPRILYLAALAASMAFSSARVLFHSHGEYESRKRLAAIARDIEQIAAGRQVLVHLFAIAPYIKAHFARPELVSAVGRSNPREPFDQHLTNALAEAEAIPVNHPFVLVTNKLAESFNDPNHHFEKKILRSRIPTSDISCGSGKSAIFCERILVFDAQEKKAINLLVSGQKTARNTPLVLVDELSRRECSLVSNAISACGPFEPNMPYRLRIRTKPAGMSCTILNPSGVASSVSDSEIRLECKDG